MRDPDGFAAQEMRHNNYMEMKRKGNVPKASVALPVLQCKMFIDSENELFYDDPYVAGPTSCGSLNDGVELTVPRIVAVAAQTRHQKVIIIAGDTVSEL